jgi:hypothetical protein
MNLFYPPNYERSIVHTASFGKARSQTLAGRVIDAQKPLFHMEKDSSVHPGNGDSENDNWESV